MIVPSSPHPADHLQRPVRDLRISVADRCNLRCLYCMPERPSQGPYAYAPRSDILSFEEITRLARILARLGVRKLRLTGGEPLLRRDVACLVSMLARLEGIEDLALTTNGLTLAEHTQALRRAGLRRVTVSLDSLDPGRFREISGGHGSLASVLEGLAAARRLGLTPIKINTVVLRGMNEDQIPAIAAFAREHGDVVRFVEYMDAGNVNGWRLEDVVTADEILARLEAAGLALDPLPAELQGGVATRYRYRDGGGEVGIIASVSRPFCQSCTRLRVSTDGKLYTCLFASHGFDVRSLLRSGAGDPEIEDSLRRLWTQRRDRYSEERSEATARAAKVEMFKIGG
ncbi:MAG: GTP 3',8-cyclase MoaA [Planctomycetota bacterium]